MKKLAILLLPLTLYLFPATAQTNFRHISFAEAQKAAQQEKKLIFVDFYTSWCGPCKMMANTVFPQQKVGDFMNAKFVCVKYDAEKEELDLVKRSNINAYPTFIIFNADGTEVNRKVGGGTAESFIADMERLSDANLTPEKVHALYNSGDRSARIMKAYLGEMKEHIYDSRRNMQERKDQMMAVADSCFDGLKDKQRLSQDYMFLYETYSENTADKKIQYLFQNRDKAPKALRADVDTILVKAYKSDIYSYISFQEPFNKEAYTTYHSQCDALGISSEAPLCDLLAIMDVYAIGDMNKYLDVVEQKVPTLKESTGVSIEFGMAGALKTADKSVKERASKFLRSQLATMSASNLMFIGQVIGQLEGTIGH